MRAGPRLKTLSAPTAPGCAPGAPGPPARPALPARASDVVAFLAAERGQGRSVATVELRRAAIRYLHCTAGCPVPTAEAQVTEAMAGMYRAAADAGQLQGKKLAATADILRRSSAPVPYVFDRKDWEQEPYIPRPQDVYPCRGNGHDSGFGRRLGVGALHSLRPMRSRGNSR
jgi:hypothetical protein